MHTACAPVPGSMPTTNAGCGTRTPDFGDLLLWPARAMQRSESYRTRWASRFDCVLADEFQDVNLAQFTWLRLLAAQHDEIFVVGDDDQSVYGWRGADVGYIRRFTRDFPNAAVYRLEE